MSLKKKITHLLASTAVAIVMQLSPVHAQNNTQLIYQYGYGYCDAKRVAAVWNVGIGQAKTIIANKIRSNLTNLIDQDIRNSNAWCSWNEVEISYNDAQQLANYWGITVNKAKDKAKDLVNQRGKKSFRNWASQRAGINLS